MTVSSHISGIPAACHPSRDHSNLGRQGGGTFTSLIPVAIGHLDTEKRVKGNN